MADLIRASCPGWPRWVLIGFLLFAICSMMVVYILPVNASGEYLPTFQQTLSTESTTTGLPTGLWGTTIPGTEMPVCPIGSKTATPGGAFRTWIWATMGGPTNTSAYDESKTPTSLPVNTSTPTKTVTPASANNHRVDMVLNVGENDRRAQTISGHIQCEGYDNAGTYFYHDLYVAPPSKAAAWNGPYLARGQCLGQLQGYTNDYTWPVAIDFYVHSLISPSWGNAYYNNDYQYTGNTTEHTITLVGSGGPVSFSNVYDTVHVKYVNSYQYITYYVNMSWNYTGFSYTPTPTFTPTNTGTFVPTQCTTPGMAVTAGNPVAWISPITYTYGACFTLVPSFDIPTLGAWDLPDPWHVGGLGFCPIYVGINAQVFGITAEYLIGAFIFILAAFGIINEFRS